MGLYRYIRNVIRHDRNTRFGLDELSKRVIANETLLKEVGVQRRMDYIRDRALSDGEMGVSMERYCETDVVVSLTTFGKRIYDVCLAIESIMQGTMKPNRIILWLAEEEFKGKALPRVLLLQQKRGLQIEYCKDIRSYKKLIPTMRRYPDACIVTIDDDAIYEFDFLEQLVNKHNDYPAAVCAHRIHRVKLDGEGKPMSYLDWEWCIETDAGHSPLHFPTGVGGILYPPNCFSEEVFNEEAFMGISPYADDVWFYAMELLNGTPVVQACHSRSRGLFVDLPSGSIGALSKENTNEQCCRNDVQIKAVFEKYNLYERLA